MAERLWQEIEEFLIPSGIEQVLLAQRIIIVPKGATKLVLSLTKLGRAKLDLVEYNFIVQGGGYKGYEIHPRDLDLYSELKNYAHRHFTKLNKESPPTT